MLCWVGLRVSGLCVMVTVLSRTNQVFYRMRHRATPPGTSLVCFSTLGLPRAGLKLYPSFSWSGIWGTGAETTPHSVPRTAWATVALSTGQVGTEQRAAAASLSPGTAPGGQVYTARVLKGGGRNRAPLLEKASWRLSSGTDGIGWGPKCNH